MQRSMMLAAAVTAWCLQGLELLAQYQHVAIFDADFKPEPDFLVSLRQTSWTHSRHANCVYLILTWHASLALIALSG